MDPVSALGLASNIIQIVDFSSRLLSRGREIYLSSEGRLDDHVILDNAARNLSELCQELAKMARAPSRTVSLVDQQLEALRAESAAIAMKLQRALESLSTQGGKKKWQSILQGLRSIWKEQDILDLKRRLDDVRKQIDTALLVSLRHAIEEWKQSPVPEQGDSIENENINNHVRQRHYELLNAIRESNWHSSNRDDVAVFRSQIHSAADVDVEARFCKHILARLMFQNMPDREESIPQAYRHTFEWLFRPEKDNSAETTWPSFTDWIQSDDERIYWITGKPGCGKSTLMKYIVWHPDTSQLAHSWSHNKKLLMASFYFWNSGSALQMSKDGLFRTLLYQCVQEDRGLTVSTFSERFEQFKAFGGGINAFTYPELRRAFAKMTSSDTRNFFFLVDGLDEFEGESKDIIYTIQEALRPNVKICVTSRPWLPFEDAFKRKPHLYLQQLSKNDIAAYVTSHFEENEFYVRLKDDDLKGASDLVDQVVEKASGVFLWVRLVVESLLEGLSNADRMATLQARLDALPSDLEALYEKILNRLEPAYYKEACRVFRLLRQYRKAAHVNPGNWVDPTLLEMYFADIDDPGVCFDAPWKPLKLDHAIKRAEDMERRLKARCRGFIETRAAEGYQLVESHVSYLHRTAKDFIESDEQWHNVLEATGYSAYDPIKCWANAFLLCHKRHPSNTPEELKNWETRYGIACVDCGILLQPKDPQDSFTKSAYFDAAFPAPNLTDIGVSLFDFVTSWRSPNPSHGIMKLPKSYVYSLMDYFVLLLRREDPRNTKRLLEKMTQYVALREHDKMRRSRKMSEFAEFDYLARVTEHFNAPPSRRLPLGEPPESRPSENLGGDDDDSKSPETASNAIGSWVEETNTERPTVWRKSKRLGSKGIEAIGFLGCARLFRRRNPEYLEPVKLDAEGYP
ncbi:hypothetical protein BDV96DRAFT_101489 [Lophiotrema nucula]|uniref:Uncharacterized protein n=1 Tax=Lophiotrema nucula TaxID=690887 RepID=A0A6A5Z6D9_9PLEO|nr:hypothetical protein BDV96DRAFT_101489 [Lophiotrema nucula]